ncbi:MAG: DUF3809 family protein [Thermus sp.]
MKARLRLTLNGHPPGDLPLEAHWEGDRLQGVLRQENPVLGELVLPFACQLEGERLRPLPLPPPCLRLEGRARPVREGLELELDLELVLPPGRTWGERAFARIVETLFLRHLASALSPRAGSPV